MSTYQRSAVLLVIACCQLACGVASAEETVAPAREARLLADLRQRGARYKLNSRQQVVKLDLSGMKLKETDLWSLNVFRQLGELSLAKTETTDATLSMLRKLPRLKALDLTGTRITNVGIWMLRDLTHLEDLSLAETQIDDRALSSLRGLRYLKSLNLTKTRVTTIGLLQLESLKRLESLNLTGTDLNDSVSILLKRLPALKFVGLSGTQVTDYTVDRLREAMVNTKIVR